MNRGSKTAQLVLSVTLPIFNYLIPLEKPQITVNVHGMLLG